MASSSCFATAILLPARRKPTPTSACTGPGGKTTIAPARDPPGRALANGNYGARALDADTRHGIWRALSAGMLRRADRTVSLHHTICAIRIHIRAGALPEVLPDREGCARMGRCADGGLRHLPLVPRCAAAGNNGSLDVSATAADVESRHHRLALAGDGVEGARRLVRADLDHNGRIRFHQVWPRPRKSSATSRRSALFCRGFVRCRGHRGLLWSDDHQGRAGSRRPHDSTEPGRRKMNTSTTTPARTNGSGAAAILSAGCGAFALAVLAVAGDKS